MKKVIFFFDFYLQTFFSFLDFLNGYQNLYYIKIKRNTFILHNFIDQY